MAKGDAVMDKIDLRADRAGAGRTVSESSSRPAFLSSQVSDVRYYFLNLRPGRTAGLTVVCGGRERCNADYRIARRRFPYHSIEFVAAGRGELTIGGRRHSLAPGTVFHYGPGEVHSIRNDPAHPMEKHFVDFAGTEAARLMRAMPYRNGVVQVTSPGEMLDAFEALLRETGVGHPARAELCAAHVRVIAWKAAALEAPAGGVESPALATYRRCRRHIEAHALELRSLHEIAKAVHVDPAYLCRLFKRFDHRSPYHFLLRVKMNRAAELLAVGSPLVKQVAEAVGFEDPYHFSRAFKAVHGLSPKAFVLFSRRGERLPD